MLRVRRSVWLVLLASICLAVLAPALELWHAYETPISARVVLIATQARVGEPITMQVTLNGVSVSLVQATELHAQTDMIIMPMHLPSQQSPAVPGQTRYLISWLYPMAGMWWIDCSLAMPGYAPWHQRMLVKVIASVEGGT